MSSFKYPANCTVKQLISLSRPNISDVIEIKISDVGLLEMEKRRNLVGPWSGTEVQTFLCFMKEPRIQKAFREGRNKEVFAEVAQHMMARGFNRTSQQCREKMKKLRFDYRRIRDRNNSSGTKRPQWRWYNDMDAIYERGPLSQSPDESMDPGLSLLTANNDSEDTVAFAGCSSSANSNDACKESVISPAQASSSAAEVSFTPAASSTQAASFFTSAAQIGTNSRLLLCFPGKSVSISNGVTTGPEQQCWSESDTEAFISLFSEVGGQATLDAVTLKQKEDIFRDLSSKLQQRGIYRTSRQCRDKLKKLKFDYFACKKSLTTDDTKLRRRTSQYKWFNLLLPVFDSTIETELQNINPLATTGLQNINTPATTGLQNINPPATTGLQNINLPATTGLQDINPPATTGLQDINPPATTGLQDINPPATTGPQDINPPAKTLSPGCDLAVPEKQSGQSSHGSLRAVGQVTSTNVSSPPPILDEESDEEEEECSPSVRSSALQQAWHNVCLPTLGLSVPPLRMQSAFMWHVAQHRQVPQYLRLEEFVCTILEELPQLLDAKEKAELLLGLRTRFILELCRGTPSVNIHLIQPHLEKLRKISKLASADQNEEIGERMVDSVVKNFTSLIQTLLESPQEARRFFQDVFPVQYGPKYDMMLQSSVWEFLCRLEKLISVPSFYQAASWFDENPSQWDNSLDIQPELMQTFLRHAKNAGLLDSAGCTSPITQNSILATLYATSTQFCNTCDEEADSEKCVSTSHQHRDSLESHGDVVGMAMECVTEAEEDSGANGCQQSGANEEDGDEQTDGGCTSHEDATCNTRSEARSEEPTSSSKSEAGSQVTGSILEAFPAERSRKQRQPCLCSYCGKMLKSKTALTYHVLIHTGELPFGCTICGKRFRQPNTLLTHKRMHTDERTHLCSFCGKSFITAGALGIHTRSHTGERPYKCGICGKTYMQRCELVVHSRRHNKERPCSCTVCDKRFGRSSLLTIHMRTHTGEKPFECLLCGKRFAARQTLKIHQRIHM